MRDTLESVFGVYVDGYIMVDFNGFTDVIDAMGGVVVDVPTEIVDDQYPTADYGTEVVRFMPGRQLMNGDRALKYVRTRHQDSDDGRRERQLQVLRALFEQAKSFDSITNGFEIITALGGSVQTSFYLDQQLTLAQLGYSMDDGDIPALSLTAPLIWGGYADSGAGSTSRTRSRCGVGVEVALDRLHQRGHADCRRRDSDRDSALITGPEN